MENKMLLPVLLAGGKSSRMGVDKAFVCLGGQPLIEIILAKLTDVFGQKPLIVTNEPVKYEYLGCQMTEDLEKEKGPLGGLHAAMTVVAADYYFVFACDMPFLDARLIRYMLALLTDNITVLPHSDVFIPCPGERPEPLHAIYSRRCLPVITAQLKTGRKAVQSIFPQLCVRYIAKKEMENCGCDEQLFANLNTPAQLQAAALLFHIK